MGIIDSTRYELSCSVCGRVEKTAAHEYGPGYWGGLHVVGFTLETQLQSYGESVVVNATCRCGQQAEVAVVSRGA